MSFWGFESVGIFVLKIIVERVARGGIGGIYIPFHRTILHFARVFEKKKPEPPPTLPMIDLSGIFLLLDSYIIFSSTTWPHPALILLKYLEKRRSVHLMCSLIVYPQ